MHTGAIARELARSWLQFAQILRECRQFSRGLHASYPFSLPPIYRYLLFIHPYFLPSLVFPPPSYFCQFALHREIGIFIFA